MGLGDDVYRYEYDKNLSASDSDSHSHSHSHSQDEISLFLRQILLRSSPNSISLSMPPGSCNSNCNAPRLDDGTNILPPGPPGTKPPPNASSSSLGVGVGLSENDTDAESEEGVEALAEQVPTKSAPSRSSSKRSRAAEVHNLSEKRRRSRINEKMKALQNLIPNSNKTDKASMLDEAIDYLKQLQLQVQMLSMRNGLSLHPMCFPEGLQSLQLSRLSVELAEENRSIPLNVAAALPVHQGNPLHYASNQPNKHTVPSQPSVPYPPYMNNSETCFGLESSILTHIKRPEPTGSSGIHREAILHHQQSNASGSDTNPFAASQVVKELESGTLAAGSLSFDKPTSESEPIDDSSLQTCIAGRDQSGVVILNSEPTIVVTSQLSR